MTSDGPRPSAPRKKAAAAGGAAALSEVIAKVKAGQLGARVDAR